MNGKDQVKNSFKHKAVGGGGDRSATPEENFWTVSPSNPGNRNSRANGKEDA